MHELESMINIGPELASSWFPSASILRMNCVPRAAVKPGFASGHQTLRHVYRAYQRWKVLSKTYDGITWTRL